MDVPFPRGNSNSSTSNGKASGGQGSHTSTNDDLFKVKKTRKVEIAPQKSKKASNKRKRNAPKSNLSATPLPGIGLGMTKSLGNSKVLKIDGINFGKYLIGCQAMGYVLQVNEDALIISLPGGVTATVPFSEASDVHHRSVHSSEGDESSVAPLSEIFQPMLPVRCHILAQQETNRKKKTLIASLRSSSINRGLNIQHLLPGFPIQGCVGSVEDKGYVIVTGIYGTTCFLPFTAVPNAMGTLGVGQSVETIVEDVNFAAHTVTLRAHRKAVSEAITRGSKLAFTSLQAGMMVNAVVENVAVNGLTVNFLGIFHGSIDMWSLPRISTGSDEWKSRFSEGDVLQARIIFIDHGSKSVRLSMRPHVIEMRSPRNLPALGDVLSSYTVTSVINKVGVVLTVSKNIDEEESAPTGKKNKKAQAIAMQAKRDADDSAVSGIFVHKSSLQTSGGDWESTYKVGKEMDVRVMGYHLVEGISVGSTISEFVDGSVVHSSQVEVGQVLEVEVLKVSDFGLVVQLGGKVRAICPSMHLTDSGHSIQLQKRYKAKQKLTMRVWEAKDSAIVMTNKKSLVQASEENILTSVQDAVEGKTAVGVVSKMSHEGLQIHFFNKVKGLIPMSVLVKQGVADVEGAYRIGQVVRCVVLQKKSPSSKKSNAKAKLLLGLDIGDTSSIIRAISDKETEADKNGAMQESTAEESISNDVTLELVSGIVIKQEDGIFQVRLDDGRLGILHKDHTCDIAQYSQFYCSASAFANGSRIENAVVLSSTGKGGTITISMKPLFRAAAGVKNSASANFSSRDVEAVSIPSRISDLSPGQIVVGYVWKVEAYGILVRFRDAMTALAPRPNVADKFIATPVGLFSVGDSVRCVVQRVDLARDRAIVTLKPAIVPPSTGMVTYLSTILRESYESTLAEVAASTSSVSIPAWEMYPVGHVVSCTVASIKEYGIVLMCPDNVTMMLIKTSDNTQNVSEGDSLDAVVVDIDLSHSVLEGTLDQALVSAAQCRDSKKAKKKKKAESGVGSGVVIAPTKCFSAGEICTSTSVVLVKERYLVVALNESTLCFVMVADYNCPYKDTTGYTLGQILPVRIEKVLTKQLFSSNMSTPYDHVTIGSLYTEESDRHRKQAAQLQKEVEQSDIKIHEKFAATKAKGLTKAVEPSVARQKFVESIRMGAILRWEVQNVNRMETTVVPENPDHVDVNIQASIHVSCCTDACDGCDDLEKSLENSMSAELTDSARKGISKLHPFSSLRKGQKVSARIVQIRHVDVDNEDDDDSAGKSKCIVVLLALVSSPGISTSNRWRRLVQWKGRDAVREGVLYAGVLTSIDNAKCTVALSPYVSCNLNMLDISSDIALIKKFQLFCYVGMRIVVAVTSVKTIGGRSSVTISRLVVEDAASGSTIIDLSKNVTIEAVGGTVESKTVKAGSVITGIVDLKSSINVQKPPALSILLAHNRTGRVCVTEIADVGDWKADYSALFSDNGGRSASKRPRSDSTTSASSVHSTESAVITDDRDSAAGPKHGDIVKCRVVCVPDSHAPIELSMRPSRVNSSSKKASIRPDSVPVVGSTVQAYVANTSSKGCFLRLSSSVTGRVLLKDLSDEYVHSPIASYPPGKLVTARVLSVSEPSVSGMIQVSLSLRGSVVLGEDSQREIESLSPGDVIAGRVHRITDFGVFVTIENSSLIGLCRKPMAVESLSDDLNDVYDVGDRVRAVILGVSGHKIALGLKPSCFNDTKGESSDESDVEDTSSDMEEDVDEEGIVLVDGDSDSEDEREVQAIIRQASLKSESGDEADEVASSDEEESLDDNSEDKQSDDSGEDSDSDDGGEVVQQSKRAKVEPLSTNIPSSSAKDLVPLDDDNESGPMMLDWGDSFKPSTLSGAQSENEESDNDSATSCDESNDDATGKKKGKKRRPADALKAEEEIRKRENAIATGTDEPGSPEDFERLLITEPNSSLLWIQYMSFHLLSADVHAARAVGLRAIRTIGFREEEEKYNVWIALLNMEHKFGTTDSLATLFRRAISESKSKYLHLHLAELYEKSGDVDGAREMFEKTLKKHKTSKKVWMAYQHFEQRGGRDKEARSLLNRSMLSLSKHKHIEVILQYASLEFELGRFERGREVFEDLLMSYPKRTDIWNVFVDKEIKYKNYDAARRIFSRMITLKISSKNIKSVFKKYLNFELTHGSEHEQEIVRQKARDYVNSIV